jgi:DNA-binding LacI/PurR family transcriptional regulator
VTADGSDPPRQSWTSQRPTIVDVANLSGVSKSTVSNVLRNAGRVSPATRDRVLESIGALGYRPNSLARDLVRRRANAIGVIVGDLANTFYAELVKLLEVSASESAYTTIVCNTDGDAGLERARVETLLERAVSGVVMLQFTGEPAVLDELGDAGVPAVVVSCWERRADCVAVDDDAGMAVAVEHLHELGHRRIAHLTGHLVEEATRAARYAGYERAMHRHGLEPAMVDADAIEAEPRGAERMRELLAAGDAPTAFTAGNDVMAVRLIERLESLGVAVPADVSVVGFDGIELGAHSRIALTTVAQPRAELVTRGLELLLERIADPGGDPERRHVRLEPELIVRRSSGPPPG